jgi:hypothetical protein
MVCIAVLDALDRRAAVIVAAARSAGVAGYLLTQPWKPPHRAHHSPERSAVSGCG